MSRDSLIIVYLIVAFVLWVMNTIEQANTAYVMGEPTPPSVIALTWPLWIAALLIFFGMVGLFRLPRLLTKDQDHV
jgi:hypothetical protein